MLTQLRHYEEQIKRRHVLFDIAEQKEYQVHKIGTYDPDRCITTSKEFFYFQAKKQGNGSTNAKPRPKITEVATGKTWDTVKEFCDHVKCSWEKFDRMRKDGILIVEGITSGSSINLTYLPTGESWHSIASAADDLGVALNSLKYRIRTKPEEWRRE